MVGRVAAFILFQFKSPLTTFEFVIASSAIFPFVIALFAIVIVPLATMLASPDMVTAVAAPLALPTKI